MRFVLGERLSIALFDGIWTTLMIDRRGNLPTADEFRRGARGVCKGWFPLRWEDSG